MAKYEQGIFYKKLSPDERDIVIREVFSHKNGQQVSQSCIRCGACCVAFDIPEIGKRAGEICQFLEIEDGDKIICNKYKDRPKDCGDYDCRFEKTTNGRRQRVVELYASKFYLRKNNKVLEPVMT